MNRKLPLIVVYRLRDHHPLLPPLRGVSRYTQRTPNNTIPKNKTGGQSAACSFINHLFFMLLSLFLPSSQASQ